MDSGAEVARQLVDAFDDAFEHGDTDAQDYAVEQLDEFIGEIDDDSGDEVLVTLLDLPPGPAGRPLLDEVARKLARRGPGVVEALLVAVFGQAPPELRLSDIISVAGAVGALLEAATRNPNVPPRAGNALTILNAMALGDLVLGLVEVLEGGVDERLKRAASEMLVDIGEPALERLTASLRDRDAAPWVVDTLVDIRDRASGGLLRRQSRRGRLSRLGRTRAAAIPARAACRHRHAGDPESPLPPRPRRASLRCRRPDPRPATTSIASSPRFSTSSNGRPVSPDRVEGAVAAAFFFFFFFFFVPADFRSAAHRPISAYGIRKRAQETAVALCAVCGTGVREGATHCTTCGTAVVPAPPPPPAQPTVSAPSPFEGTANWYDPPAGRLQGAGSNPPSAAGRPVRSTAPHSNAFKVILIAAIVVVVAALLAVVALPRLFLAVDPQKFVGTWAYAGNASDKVVITRQENAFMIVFANKAGASRQSLPGKVSDGKLVIDYDALGPQGPIIKKLADEIGAHLSFAYRKSDDSLVLTGSNRLGSFSLVLRRSTLV